MNLRRLGTVAWKEWREIVRDRMFFTLAFGIPSVFVLLFGYGLSTDVEHLPLVIVDRGPHPVEPRVRLPVRPARATSTSRATSPTNAPSPIS